ncbi:MAG: hypothetical protein ABSF51_00800 [Verrucomicrobiota bacterium]|jgi:hypothetical protein
MPIRINLLAEAQAAEDLRRRDPIKRVIFWGVLVVALMLAWWSWLQLRVMVASQHLSEVQAQIQSHTNAYQVVVVGQRKITEAKQSLAALQKLTSSRFLQGDLLEALQRATVPGVQLMRLRVDQTYVATEAGASDAGDTVIKPGRTGTVAESIVVSLDARDFSGSLGDQVNKFKDIISQEPYFQAELDKTNGVRLTNLSPPQVGQDGKPSVLFTLQCKYPDIIR